MYIAKLPSSGKFQIRFKGCRDKVENVSAKQRQEQLSLLPIGPNTQTWSRTLINCFLSSLVQFCSVVVEEKEKMSQSIRGQGSHLGFLINPDKHKLCAMT